MLNIGDAVLTFLGDTSQLDQVFARLPAQAEASMASAASSVGQVGTATQGLNFELDATAQNVPYAGEVIKETMGKAESSTREARGEAALLGEAFGIHLPRHVRSFLAEIPGISTALSAAFGVTAVFFLVEALVQAVEKIQQFREHAHDVELAWEGFNAAVLNSMGSLDDKALEAGASLDRLRGDHLAALRKELELIDHTSLRDLMSEFDLLAKASDAMFAQINRNWLQMDMGSTGAKNALTDFKAQYELLLAEGKKKEASDLLAGTLKSAEATLAVMQNQDLVTSKLNVAAQLLQGNAAGVAAAFAQSAGHGEREVKAQETLIRALQAQVDAEKKITDYINERKQGKEIQESNREEKSAEALAKKQEQLFFEVAKAHAALEKQLEKDADEIGKHEGLRLTTQLKEEQVANVEQLKLIQQREQAAIAEIDGEIQHSQDMVQTKALGYKKLFDLGIMDGQAYLGKLQQLYQQEVADLQKMLQRKQQLVILEAQNEAAQHGRILSDADAKELKSYVDVENQKQKVTDQFTVKFAKDQDNVAKAADKVFRTRANWDQFFKHLQTEALTTGQKFKLLGDEITASFGQSVEAAVSGADSFGDAMQKILKSALASLAGEAAVHVLKELAYAASDLANPFMSWHAGLHFAAAAKWAAVGALAGGAGAAIGGGSGSGAGGGGSNNATIDQTATANKAVGQTVSTANLPHLASGAIVTKPTQVVVGDKQGGGSSVEGVFPLDDSRSAQAIRRLFGMGSGTQNHYYIDGFKFSASDMSKLTRQLTRDAKTGRARVSVADAARVTRRG